MERRMARGGGNVGVRVWVVLAVMGVLLVPTHTEFLDVVLSRLFQDLPALKRTVITQTHTRPSSTRLQERSGRMDVGSRHCFQELGCMETGPDFFHNQHRPFNMDPNTREQIRVQYKVRSRSDPRGVLVQGLDVPKILTSSFSPSRPTKIVVHGYLDGRDMPWLEEILDAYLKTQDINAIYVNWTNGSLAIYPQAVANARVVGMEIAYLINWLKDNVGLNPKNVHIIGHSLGSHVAGYAGERVEGLGRITGLDPADPEFQHMPPAVRLDPTDAIFVDVIHTDAGQYNLVSGYGLVQPIGHLDFYPNGGIQQPGCNGQSEEPLWPFLLLHNFSRALRSAEGSVGCNHVRAANFFTDSIISSCPYVAFQCNDYQQFRRAECFSCGNDGSRCAQMGDSANTWPSLTSGQLLPTVYHYMLKVEIGPSGCGNGFLKIALITPNGNEGNFDLTRRSPRSFEAGKTYTFYLEHKQDFSMSDEAIVTWNNVVGNIAHCNTSIPTSLPLTGISVVGIETTTQRQLSGRSLGQVSTERRFCGPGGIGETWISDARQQTTFSTAQCSISQARLS